MIVPFLGKLSTAQDFTSAQTKDSEDVMELAGVDWGMLANVWWIVDTETIATGDGSDTYAFQLVLSQEEGLTTNVEVLKRTVTGYEAYSLAGAGRHIVCCNLGDMLNEILGTDLSDYPFLGMITAVSDGATLSINAVISMTKPDTISHGQAVESNVGVPDNAT